MTDKSRLIHALAAALVLLLVSSARAQVAWWPGEGNAHDIRSHNHGTLLNGVSFAPGTAGSAFLFDGDDDIVWIPRSAILEPPELTVAAWFNAADFIGDRYNIILGKQASGDPGSGDNGGAASYALVVDTLGRPRVHVWNGVVEQHVISPSAIAPTQWHQIAATVHGDGITLYLDGVQVASGPMTGNVFYNTAPGFDLEIGSFLRLHGPYFAFHGLIDEVVLFDRSLSPSEIRAMYDAVADGDGDGVPDAADLCPASFIAPTVIVGDCDSGVANRMQPDGCGIADAVARCTDDARNHGSFVGCVARLAGELTNASLITTTEAGALRSCAGRGKGE